jgi:hypothetical protein
MSYDLYIEAGNGKSLDKKLFAAWFRRRANYQVGKGQALYQNEDTGVYFIFDEPNGGLVAMSGRDEVVDVAGGWHVHLDVLSDVLRGERERRPFWVNVTELHATYAQRIPQTPGEDGAAAGV